MIAMNASTCVNLADTKPSLYAPSAGDLYTDKHIATA